MKQIIEKATADGTSEPQPVARPSAPRALGSTVLKPLKWLGVILLGPSSRD